MPFYSACSSSQHKLAGSTETLEFQTLLQTMAYSLTPSHTLHHFQWISLIVWAFDIWRIIKSLLLPGNYKGSYTWGLLWCDIRDHWVGMQFAHPSGLFTHFQLVPNKLGLLYSPFMSLDKFHSCLLFLWQMVSSACSFCMLIVYMIISCSAFGFQLVVWCLFTCLLLAHCLLYCYSPIGTINI